MSTATLRNLGPEFWAVIGTASAIAALVLTVTSWQRADMRDLRMEMRSLQIEMRTEMRGLGQKIEAMQVGQGKIRERLRAVEVGQDAIRERLSAVESRIGAAVGGEGMADNPRGATPADRNDQQSALALGR